MSDLDPIRQRLKLMLRAERAFGVSGVVASDVIVAEAEEREPEPLVVEKPATRPALPVEPIETHGKPVAVPALFGAQPAAGIELGPERPPFTSPVFPRAQKLALLEQLDQDEVKGCPKCDLCKTRTHTVFGEGDPDARLMFIGEGPGENEDLQGRPFCGRSGELLTKMINGMGLKREQVYIANIVKCRPPDNRVPTRDEVATCTPYLEKQIELIRPTAIVTLGLPSAQYMLQSKTPMGKLRGNWQTWRGIALMPTYHPAYLLRNYTDATRAAVWSDLQQVMKKLGLAAPTKK